MDEGTYIAIGFIVFALLCILFLAWVLAFSLREYLAARGARQFARAVVNVALTDMSRADQAERIARYHERHATRQMQLKRAASSLSAILEGLMWELDSAGPEAFERKYGVESSSAARQKLGELLDEIEDAAGQEPKPSSAARQAGVPGTRQLTPVDTWEPVERTVRKLERENERREAESQRHRDNLRVLWAGVGVSLFGSVLAAVVTLLGD